MIRYANEKDFHLLKAHEHGICDSELKASLASGRILALFQGGTFLGWLRYNLFWDNTPFLNKLYFLEEYRGQGYGTQLMAYWEAEMRKLGYQEVLTSTLSSERAQLFYRKNGYVDCGVLLLPGEPSEIFLRKALA